MLTGIIGNPISHSLSPIIHSHWMRQHSIKSSYNIYQVEKDELTNFIKKLYNNNIKGLNVTIPYKRDIMPYLNEIDEEASALGAVNTIKVGENNKLYGFNTDAYGFMKHLTNSVTNWKEKKGAIVVIGAGGASRAVVWSFLKEKKYDIRIINRNEERARILINDMKKLFPQANIIFNNDINHALINASLLVNCSSLGMIGQPKLKINLELMNRNSIVYDIVYSPLRTELLKKAKGLNFVAVDGLGMLLNQAAPAFEMWFNKKVIVNELLRKKVVEHLERI